MLSFWGHKDSTLGGDTTVAPAGQAVSTYLLTHFPDRCHTWLLLRLHASSRNNPSVWMAATAHEQHLKSEVTGRSHSRRYSSQSNRTSTTVTRTWLSLTATNNFTRQRPVLRTVGALPRTCQWRLLGTTKGGGLCAPLHSAVCLLTFSSILSFFLNPSEHT